MANPVKSLRAEWDRESWIVKRETWMKQVMERPSKHSHKLATGNLKLETEYMFKNYLKTAWRNLWKNKVFSAINIIGLSVGMAACIVIMVFVFYERSFDSFHSKNIYRLNEVQKFPGMVASQKVALSVPYGAYA